MRHATAARLVGGPTVRLLAPLLLTFAFAVALAHLALDATRTRREAARRTVGDFASFAAFIVGNAAQQEIERRLLYAFSPLRAWDGAPDSPLPSPALVGRDQAEAHRCAAAGIAEPTFARLDLRSHELALAGAPLSDAAARWLADTLAVEAREYGSGWSFAHVFGDHHGVPLVAYTLLRDDAHGPVAVYAKTSCFELGETSVFAHAAASTTAFPPTLTGGRSTDSLMALRALDPHGDVVFTSHRAWASTVSATTGPLAQLGDAELAVDLAPGMESRLVVGGVPYGGTPMAVLLVLLLVVSGGLTVLQFRRQHALMRARERFISNVSHELRTPLQQILLFAELMRMDPRESPDERRHAIEVVERETRRLIALVENVLSFARPRSADRELAREAVELGPLVRETMATFEPLARTRSATLRLAGDPAARVTGDADAIRRTLLNLLDNAVKYGPSGQTVTVTVGRDGDRSRLSVDDQGPGIPPAQRERIWLPFSRLEREERAAVAGSGIGLAIVGDLVARMGGSVDVADAPGGGARFVVSLPGADA